LLHIAAMGREHSNSIAQTIDHLVLPVADLPTARARLTALGFTVAPDGIHPFGTANCCVYFAEGPYLEPLAVVDREKTAAEARDGNVFAAHDGAYRVGVAEEGFSSIAIGSGNAAAEHARFVAAGISAGRMFEFSRPFIDAAGREDTATFRVAFATERQVPHVLLFAVERVKVPQVDRRPLQAHPNGVTGVCKVLLSAAEPHRLAALLAEVFGAQLSLGNDGELALAAANAGIVVTPPAALEEAFGIAAHGSLTLAVGIVLRVADLDSTEALLRAGQIAFERRGARLIVPPAPGQGAAFIFEES
jgi:hypothetical protein